MAKYHRANNKRGYLNTILFPASTQMTLQTIGYGGGAKDRNIPTIIGKTMRLVIWGIQYPNPSAAPDREVVSAVWSGSGQIFDITRAQEDTEAGEHYVGDNIALLFTADMSREILIFEDFENSLAGSIAYTEDTDEDGEMEVLALLPDDEVEITSIIIPPALVAYDSYTDDIDFQKTVYWIGATYVWFTQTFTPDVDYNIKSVVLKLYRTGTPGDITVSIKATGDGKPVGLDLCTKTLNGNGITTDSEGEEVIFLFSTPGSLTAGVQYAIVLKSPETELTYISWKIDKADAVYSGGSTFISYDEGSTWDADPAGGDGDFYFKTYGYTDESVEYIEEEFKKILVSGGVGEPPYWQFIWADEVGGTKRV